MTRRLAAAKEDLAYRRDSVLVTAQRWGFKDPSHFTRRFKAMYAATPREYLDEIRSEEQSRKSDAD